MERRKFLQQLATTTVLVGASQFPLSAFAREDVVKLTILHTNDVHSRIDPFPMDGSRMQGLGGVAKRMTLINKIRSEEEHVLLLDAGDIFQGTPYFNFFGGEVEFKAMNAMGYDAATIGNHDFDGGIQNLADQLTHADFKMLNANYRLEDTVLQNKVQPYHIFQRGDIRIGVFGLGIELDGLVPCKLYGKTEYTDPIRMANNTALELKKHHDCHYVVCLSHLGYKYRGERISDIKLAQMSANIDLILGGHTHTFMNEPDVRVNSEGQRVWINQVGWAGAILGRIDLTFDRVSTKKSVRHLNMRIA